MWRSEWSTVKVLFLLGRYLSLVNGVLMMIVKCFFFITLVAAAMTTIA